MNERGGDNPEASRLRRRAEDRLAEKDVKNGYPDPPDLLRMLQELQVYQIELEMQNEELVKARDEVEAGLERYTNLYEFAPVGYFTLDGQAKIVAVNLTGAALLGVERVNLLGQTFDTFAHPAERAFFRQTWEKVCQDGGRAAYELKLSLANQPARHVLIKTEAAGRGEDDARRYRLAVMDITLHKQAEQILQSEQELSAIFENASIIMLLVDQDHRVLKSNQKAFEAAAAGRRELQLTAKRYAEAVKCLDHLDDPFGCGYGQVCQGCVIRNTVLNTLDTGKSWSRVEAILRRNEGGKSSSMFFLVSTALVGKGARKLVLVCLDDITERKLVENELLGYQQTLGELASELFVAEEGERRRIAANLHDTVVQYLGLCSQKLKLLRSGQSEFRSTIDEVIGHLDQAIVDSRDLIGELSPPVLYIIGLVPALERLAQSLSEQRNLKVDLSLQQLPQPLDMPLSLFLYRACSELLTNVVKHAPSRYAHVRLALVDDHLLLSVEDGGPGFAYSDELHKAHHKFGLFNIREMLRNWHGRLLVEQPPGGGSKVTLEIPASLCWPAQKLEGA
jgi:PAS domain S-box-containing protein